MRWWGRWTWRDARRWAGRATRAAWAGTRAFIGARTARPPGWRAAVLRHHRDQAVDGARAFWSILTRARVLGAVGLAGTLAVSAGLSAFNLGRLPHDPVRVTAGAILLGLFGVAPLSAFFALGYSAAQVFGTIAHLGSAPRPPRASGEDVDPRPFHPVPPPGRPLARRVGSWFARWWRRELAADGVFATLRARDAAHLRRIAARGKRATRAALQSRAGWDFVVTFAALYVAVVALLAGGAAVLHWINGYYDLVRVPPPWGAPPAVADAPGWFAPRQHLRAELRRGIGPAYNDYAFVAGTAYGWYVAAMLARSARPQYAGSAWGVSARPDRAPADAAARTEAGRRAASTVTWTLALVAAPALLIAFIVFGLTTYPELDPRFGGGAASVVRLAVRDGGGVSPAPGLELPAALLAQEGNSATLLTCNRVARRRRAADSSRSDGQPGAAAADGRQTGEGGRDLACAPRSCCRSGPADSVLQPSVVTVTIGGPLQMEHVVATTPGTSGTLRDSADRAHMLPLTPAAYAVDPTSTSAESYTRATRAAEREIFRRAYGAPPPVCDYLRALADSLPPLPGVRAVRPTSSAALR